MLGWEISVYRTELEVPPTKLEERSKFYKECFVASWFVGFGGRAWIEDLEEKGTVKLLSDNHSYPLRYQSTARVILPIIAGGAPSGKHPPIIGDDYLMPENWKGGVEMEPDNIRACNPDDLLLIEAMDQS